MPLVSKLPPLDPVTPLSARAPGCWMGVSACSQSRTLFVGSQPLGLRLRSHHPVPSQSDSSSRFPLTEPC